MSRNSTQIMDKLAWRAKWRRRWSEWRNMFVGGFLLLFVATVALVFTPWLPNKIYTETKRDLIDPMTDELRPEAVERMYNLGMFYQITMRGDEAMICYRDIAGWFFGFDPFLRFNKAEQPEDIEKLSFPPGTEKYAARAMENMYEFYRLKRKELLARFIGKLYMDTFYDEPYVDQKALMNMETYVNRRF